MKANRANGRRKGALARDTKPSRLFGILGVIAVFFVSLGVGRFFSHNNSSSPPASENPAPKLPRTFAELIALQPKDLEGTEIALMNLLCADGLPGAENLNVDECLATLDRWARHVKSETDRNHHRFQEDRAYYYNSEAFYKMLMMAVVVYEDFGVRYNPKWIAPPSEIRGDDHFFADSRDILIHGMLGPERMGTCSSMPILYIALGRRLGYPLKLVSTKQHLFMRWDSPTEKFDMDATGKGLDHYEDDHYKKWPFPVGEDEIRENGYLKSMTTAEELSVFLTIRGACLTEAGRLAEATLTFRSACLREPNWRGNQVLFVEAQDRQSQTELALRRLQVNQGSAHMPADPNPLRQIKTPTGTP